MSKDFTLDKMQAEYLTRTINRLEQVILQTNGLPGHLRTTLVCPLQLSGFALAFAKSMCSEAGLSSNTDIDVQSLIQVDRDFLVYRIQNLVSMFKCVDAALHLELRDNIHESKSKQAARRVQKEIRAIGSKFEQFADDIISECRKLC